SAELVKAGVEMSSDVRKHGAFQIFVLQKNCAQLVLLSIVGGFDSQRVGIVKPAGCKLVKGRIGIWRSFFINRKVEYTCCNTNLGETRKGGSQQNEEQDFPSHRFHPGERVSRLGIERIWRMADSLREVCNGKFSTTR